MCIRPQYNYKVIISSLINLSMRKTGYIIHYTTLCYYALCNIMYFILFLFYATLCIKLFYATLCIMLFYATSCILFLFYALCNIMYFILFIFYATLCLMLLSIFFIIVPGSVGHRFKASIPPKKIRSNRVYMK